MSLKEKLTQPQDSNLKALRDLWPCLHFWQRKAILIHAYWFLVPRLHSPVAFSLIASLIMFALLPVMPQHPISILVTIGSGISLALIWVSFKSKTIVNYD